ncbi:PREDICTED: uncharacterized protein LOC104721068 [Camelina sativa]|uniref:Uncharacterized protein LOC104721068 n=1 Tax=Camelina sativa TaxID=90675 RepID=A0ABM0U7W8_CAMSA|nr:PREDICTED: uncharacterized protein LOC104721068 [Camelina sativa]
MAIVGEIVEVQGLSGGKDGFRITSRLFFRVLSVSGGALNGFKLIFSCLMTSWTTLSHSVLSLAGSDRQRFSRTRLEDSIYKNTSQPPYLFRPALAKSNLSMVPLLGKVPSQPSNGQGDALVSLQSGLSGSWCGFNGIFVCQLLSSKAWVGITERLCNFAF